MSAHCMLTSPIGIVMCISKSKMQFMQKRNQLEEVRLLSSPSFDFLCYLVSVAA